jgi:hypothetical protein
MFIHVERKKVDMQLSFRSLTFYCWIRFSFEIAFYQAICPLHESVIANLFRLVKSEEKVHLIARKRHFETFEKGCQMTESRITFNKEPHNTTKQTHSKQNYKNFAHPFRASTWFLKILRSADKSYDILQYVWRVHYIWISDRLTIARTL